MGMEETCLSTGLATSHASATPSVASRDAPVSAPDAKLLRDRIMALHGEWGDKVRTSLGVLKDTLLLGGSKRVVTAFNGGKDAVVVLHLLRAALVEIGSDDPPQAVFFQGDNEFEEIIKFTNSTAEELGVALETYGGSYAVGIKSTVDNVRREEFPKQTPDTPTDDLAMVSAPLDTHSSSSASAPSTSRVMRNAMEESRSPDACGKCLASVVFFVMGTRLGDPDCVGNEGLSAQRPSDDWIPTRFMRVQPIVRWSYNDVWRFLRELSIPYCELYNEGYTSIGSKPYTLRNPHLECADGSYSPAYELTDGSLERSGRKAKVVPLAKTENLYKAGVIIVSKEVLSGAVADLTSPEFISAVKATDFMKLSKLSVIDDLMCEEIGSMSKQLDTVLISSSVECAHDSLLAEAVAAAFEMGLKTVSAGKVSLQVPMSCEVIEVANQEYPILKVQNVILFPGPHYGMKDKLRALRKHFPARNSKESVNAEPEF